MSLTTDRNDQRLGRGVDTEPTPQHEVYLVMSDEDLARGFVRPVRQVYIHAKGCGAETRMGLKLAETYAADPNFYGATYCVRCQRHLAVGEFTWEDGSVVGS